MKILAVIPAYNCARQISRVISKFDERVSGLIQNVLIIENQSEDNTVNEAIKALKFNKNINGILCSNKKNVGYGGTLKIGFNFAIENNYDYLLVLHGDDQGDLSDILPYIIDKSIENFDCTLGARFHPDSKLYNYSWFRTFGNKVYNKIFSMALNQEVLDLGSGINIYKLSSFFEKDYLKFSNDLTFDYCGIISHSYRKRDIRFIPITWREEDQVSNVKISRQALFTLNLLTQYGLNNRSFINRDKSNNKDYTYSANIIYENSEKYNHE